jgi:hypothetical protein
MSGSLSMRSSLAAVAAALFVIQLASLGITTHFYALCLITLIVVRLYQALARWWTR